VDDCSGLARLPLVGDCYNGFNLCMACNFRGFHRVQPARRCQRLSTKAGTCFCCLVVLCLLAEMLSFIDLEDMLKDTAPPAGGL
jgi:hypothetical protein